MSQSDSVLLAQWLDLLTTEQRSPNTLKAYQRDVNKLLIFLHNKNKNDKKNNDNDPSIIDENRSDLQFLSRESLTHYAGFRMETGGLSPSSLQRELSAIRHFADWLVSQLIISNNPAQGYTIKRPPRPLPNTMDAEVIKQLLDQSAPDDRDEARLWVRDRAMLELLYSSGLRLSELTDLTLPMLDMGRRLVTVTGK